MARLKEINEHVVAELIDEGVEFNLAITPSEGIDSSAIRAMIEGDYEYFGWHEGHQSWYFWMEDPREEEEDEEDEEDEG